MGREATCRLEIRDALACNMAFLRAKQALLLEDKGRADEHARANGETHADAV